MNYTTQPESAHWGSINKFVCFCFTFLFFCCIQIVVAQGPSGYTYCAPENGTFTLPAKSHVAYGANNKFKYLFNQTGTIKFDNETFGGDPIFGTYKSGYYKIANGQESTAKLTSAINQIKNHVTGAAPLSLTKINMIADTIQQNIFVIADSSAMVLTAFDLVDCYELLKGPIFVNQSTKSGFPNEFGANDGFQLVRAVFLVQQGIMDYVYTPENIQKYHNLLIGRKYKTADYFPGVCPSPIDPLATYTAKINGSMPTEYGKRTAFSSTPARRPTGYYLAPGSMGTVTVPASMVNKGFKILVGAHTFERTGSDPVRRFFRVTNTFPINSTVTEIANPFGGGIYIITPYEANEGVVDIQLTNVVPAPFFSAKSFDKTTLGNWLNTQRTNPAPWADFESDKYMMQVPRSWIYNYADPVTLMQDWDARMDVVSKLLGYPAVRNNTILYLQIDVDIMFGGYGIGNPQINNTYDPYQVENGNKDHWFLKPGVDFWETEFHEMGHAQLFSNFPGEGEASVNLLAAAIYNRLYGMDIDQALGESFDNHPQITRDQAALNWMVTPNFRAGNPMDISNTTRDEVRYQQRGYAKYVEMAALFGWEVIDSFYRKEQLDFIASVPDDGLSEVDSRIFRFSKTAGVDIRPLIHFWGVHPQRPDELNNAIAAEDLKPSKLICDRLTHYKSIIPLNNAQFVAHANAFFGGSVPPGGNPDYGSGWYNLWMPQYNASHGALAQEAMQDIIDLYFPDGCPLTAKIPSVDVNSPSICSGESVTLTASGAMYYQWNNGATTNSITVSPSETTTYTVIGKTAGYSSAPSSAKVTVNPIPNVTATNATICSGTTANLTATGATTYKWSNGATGSSISVNPSETTTYTLTGTSKGCTSPVVSTTVMVNPIPIIAASNATICEGESATLSAEGATTYAWSNGETNSSITVSPATTTTYTITGTESGCNSAPITTEVTVNAIPKVLASNATICEGASVILSAQGATTYAWDNGETGNSIVVSPGENTTYSLTGTSNGCTSPPVSVAVTVNPIPTISVNDATICAGTAANLSAEGATTYAWSNGATGSSISVNPSETTVYTLTGTALGCTSAPVSTAVTVKPTPSISANDATICAGTAANLTAEGATDYAWSNGETSSSITVNPSETTVYTLTGTAEGCTSAPISVAVTVNPIPIISVNDATICAGTAANLVAEGATTYVWSNGETSSSISVNPSETTVYTLTGTAEGCTSAPISVAVTVNPIPIISVNDATICAGTAANLSAEGATTYAWSNGETNSSISVNPSETTVYTLTGMALGCTSAPISVAVTVNPIPTISVNDDTICAGTAANLTAEGATAYAWSNGETNSSISVNPSETTVYTLTGTALGCTSAPIAATVTVNPIPVITVNNAAICAGAAAILSADGAVAFVWSNGATGSTISVSPSETTTYTLVGTSLGCASALVSAEVVVNALPMVDLGSDIILQQGQAATLNAAGTDLTYLWSTGATTPNLMVNSMGTYTVTVTNSAGCTATDAIQVNVITTANDLNEDWRIIAFPNPAQSSIQITCSGSSTNNVQIMDNLGRIILEDKTFSPDGAPRMLQIADLTPGVYYVRVSGNRVVKTVKIVKE